MGEVIQGGRTRDLCSKTVLRWMAESFEVRADIGTLIWTNPPKNHYRLVGKEAGSDRTSKSNKKYVHIKWNKRALKRGWLIFLWVNGRWPSTDCIDHIDGNSMNDSISNLREATVTENAWNHRRRKRSVNLPMGVRFLPSGKYQARIGYRGSQIHLGTHNTEGEARAVYLAKRKELFREFA